MSFLNLNYIHNSLILMIEHNMHAIEGDAAMHKRKHTCKCYEGVIP